jgi:hypothetical protein
MTLSFAVVTATLMLAPEGVSFGRVIGGLGPVTHRGYFGSAEQ